MSGVHIEGREIVTRWRFGEANARFMARPVAKIDAPILPSGTPVAAGARACEYTAWRPGLHCCGMVLGSRGGFASILLGNATVDGRKISAHLSEEARAALKALGIEISQDLARRMMP